MKEKLTWQEQLKKVLTEHDNSSFGHNTEVDIEWYLKKIDRLDVSDTSKIEILDYYTVRITLPEEKILTQDREAILLFVLTTSPMPTECRYNKKKNQLTI